jgi:hypothetical protein
MKIHITKRIEMTVKGNISTEAFNKLPKYVVTTEGNGCESN